MPRALSNPGSLRLAGAMVRDSTKAKDGLRFSLFKKSPGACNLRRARADLGGVLAWLCGQFLVQMQFANNDPALDQSEPEDWGRRAVRWRTAGPTGPTSFMEQRS